MPVSVGKIVDGVISGVTNFGAFVQLPEGKTGLVHISEISHDYVKKVSDYLKKDQKVKVKIISISDEGKISLSIRQATKKEKQRPTNQPEEIDWTKKDEYKQKRMSFEDKLSTFLKDSSERQEQLKSRENKKSNGYRRA